METLYIEYYVRISGYNKVKKLLRIHKNKKTEFAFLCEVQKCKKTFDFWPWTVHNK